MFCSDLRLIWPVIPFFVPTRVETLPPAGFNSRTTFTSFTTSFIHNGFQEFSLL